MKVSFQEVGAVCDILTKTKFFLPWLVKQQADKNASVAFKRIETVAKEEKQLTEVLKDTRERRRQLTEKQDKLMKTLEALGKTAAPSTAEGVAGQLMKVQQELEGLDEKDRTLQAQMTAKLESLDFPSANSEAN